MKVPHVLAGPTQVGCYPIACSTKFRGMNYLELPLLLFIRITHFVPSLFVCAAFNLLHLPAQLEGEQSNVRFKGIVKSGETGTKSSLEGFDRKGASKGNSIIVVGKFPTVKRWIIIELAPKSW